MNEFIKVARTIYSNVTYDVGQELGAEVAAETPGVGVVALESEAGRAPRGLVTILTVCNHGNNEQCGWSHVIIGNVAINLPYNGHCIYSSTNEEPA